MKPIELSRNQRSRLLEICKKLFPKDNVEFSDMIDIQSHLYRVKLDELNRGSEYLIFTKKNEGLCCIQWFELILSFDFAQAFSGSLKGDSIVESIELNDGIWDATTYYHEMMHILEWGNIHIVDYIYEIFKR